MIESAWIGESTVSTSCACVCVDTAGTVTLSGDGFTAPASQSVDPAVNSGVARFNVTGLEENKSYPATVTFTGGNSIDVTLKTLSTKKVHVVTISCTDSNKSRKYAWDNLRDVIDSLDAPVIIMSIGDFGYPDNTSESYGSLTMTPSSQINANANPSGYQDSYYKTRRIMHQLPWVQNIIRHNTIYFAIDDHDIFDGWDWSLLQANRMYIDDGAPSVEQIPNTLSNADKLTYLKNMYDVPRAIVDDFAVGNPVNTDSNLDTYPSATYFRQRIGTLVEIFFFDALSYRHPRTQGGIYTEPEAIIPDGVNKTMFGDTGKAFSLINAGSGDGKQLPWFKIQMAASEAAGVKHKIISCNKKTHPNANNNVDNMGNWSYERDRILKWLVDNSITSVVWGTGDRHDTTVINRHGDETIDAAIVDLNHICVSACPIGRYQVGPLPAGGAGYELGVVWKRAGDSGDYSPWDNIHKSFSIATVTEDKQTWRIYDAQGSGSISWEGYVNAGENVLTYNKQKFT